MTKKQKWFFTIAFIGVFLLLGGSIPNDPLGDRAMAVGLGIDLSPEGELVASAQILTAAASESDAGTRVVSASGKLLNTAVSNLTETCGQTLTVTHCNVVLLGSALIESGKAIDVLFTLLENSYISDNAYVFACDGTPAEIFSSRSAFGENASRYLQQMISTYGTYENIAYRTLAQVVVGHETIGKTTYMPYVVKREVSPRIPASSSSEPPADTPDYAYDLNAVLLLKDGKKVGVYGEHALRAINYLLTDVKKGSEDFEIPGGAVGFFILENRAKLDVDLPNKTFRADLEVGVTVKDYRPPEGKPRQDGVFSYELTAADKAACERHLKEEILSFWRETQEKNADVFCLHQRFYSRYGTPGPDLSDVEMLLTVRLSVER